MIEYLLLGNREGNFLKKLLSQTAAFVSRSFTGEFFSSRQVWNIFLPIFVDQAFIVCLSFLNTAMISSSGVDAVSAVNMVDSLNIFLVNIFIAVATGGTVVVAQYRGSRNETMVSKSAAGAMSSVFLLAVGIGAFIMVLHNPTLSVLFGKADPHVLGFARTYLIGSGLSYPGIAVMEAACGALRGVGETKSSLILSLANNVSYVLLNVLFINGLHMGVFGMVFALNISRWFAAVCSILYLVRVNVSLKFRLRDAVRFDPAMLKKIFLIGIPFAAEQMFFNGGKILTQTFIVQLGTYAIAVNAICGSVIQLFQIAGNAACLCVVTLVGQCVGQKNIVDARKFIRSFLVGSSISFLIMVVLLFPFLGGLISLFSPPAQMVPTVRNIVMMTAIFQVFLWSVSFVTPAALRAAGDAGFTSVVSMLSMWLFRVVLGYLLGIHTPLGILGVWLAMDCEWGVRAAVFLLRYRGKKWYSHHLID
jgi:putative MATE family efflux protein